MINTLKGDKMSQEEKEIKKQNLLYSIKQYTDRVKTLKEFYNEDNQEGRKRIKALKESIKIFKLQLKEL